MLEELEFPYSFDEKDCESKTLRALLSQNRWIVDVASRRANPFQNLVVRKLQEQGFSDTMIQDLFSCYLKKGEPLQNNRQEVQKNIRFLVEAGKQCMKEYVSKRELEQISYELDDMGMLKRNYEMPAESSNIYPLLCNLRIDVLREHVLSPEHSEVYESLCQTMKKYKLHVLPDVLKSLLERKTIDISSDSVNIASFLSYYHQIYETERKKLLGDNQKGSVMISLTSALKQADVNTREYEIDKI